MRKLLLRRILPALIIVAILCLGGVYALLRSETFIKNQVLPRLSRQLGQSISAERVELWPFRGLALQGVRFNCEGAGETCPPNQAFSLTIGSLEAQYDFSALFSRRLHITSLRAADVHVGMTTGQQQPQTSRSDEPSATSPSASPKDSATSTFTFRISDAALERSSFTFRDTTSGDNYSFEQIAIKIPEVDSHQNGTISISARATIRSASTTIQNQPLSLAATLRNSTMFMPETLDVEISGGASSPKPIELQGSLVFTQDPYTLQKIKVSKGTIRHSLLQLLAMPYAPLKEFAYSLRGEYELTWPATATIDLAIQKNLFEHGSNHNLEGTTLSSKLKIASDQIAVTDTTVSLVDNGSGIFASSLKGTVSLNPYTTPSTIKLDASLLHVDRIRTLLHEIQPQPETPERAPKDLEAPITGSTPLPSASTNANLFKLPIGILDARVDKVVVQGIETKSFNIGVKVPNSRTIEKASLDAIFSEGGSLSMNAVGSFDDLLTFKASGKNVNMIPFAAAASGPKGEILEGSLQALDVNISANAADIRKTLQGHATISLSRLIVPSTLQEQVPFNILFLPLDALITVFGGTLNMLLPASISSISDSIRQTLDDAGRLGIDNSIVDLGFEKGKIILKNVDINTKNLPDFTFKGSISPEDRLDLTVFIALLKLNLPLPIAGTMSTPLPDIMYLGPELVRGLGLSIGSIAGSAASIFGGRGAKTETAPQDGSREPQAPKQ